MSWDATMTIKIANPAWRGGIRGVIPQTYAEPGSSHGPDDQRRQGQEVMEADRDVATGADHAGEHAAKDAQTGQDRYLPEYRRYGRVRTDNTTNANVFGATWGRIHEGEARVGY